MSMLSTAVSNRKDKMMFLKNYSLIVFFVLLLIIVIIIFTNIVVEEDAVIDGDEVIFVTLCQNKKDCSLFFYDLTEANFMVSAPMLFLLQYTGKINIRQELFWNGEKIIAEANRNLITAGYTLQLYPEYNSIYYLKAVPHWKIVRIKLFCISHTKAILKNFTFYLKKKI